MGGCEGGGFDWGCGVDLRCQVKVEDLDHRVYAECDSRSTRELQEVACFCIGDVGPGLRQVLSSITFVVFLLAF